MMSITRKGCALVDARLRVAVYNVNMYLRLIVWEYIVWHYTTAIADIVSIFGNFLSFLYHIFSIPVLARTLFTRWYQLGETREKVFDIGRFFSALLVNTIMRAVGFFVRISVITAGICSIIMAILAGIAVFVFWLFVPLINILILAVGVILIFS